MKLGRRNKLIWGWLFSTYKRFEILPTCFIIVKQTKQTTVSITKQNLKKKKLLSGKTTRFKLVEIMIKSLHLFFLTGSCPYYMNGQLNGRFTSPNYPSNYGSYDRCSLLIEAPYGHHIYLQFRSFSLESGSSCGYDYVEIYDGSSQWSPRITRACGQRQNLEIYSSGRFLYVKFSSDGSVQYSGFSAYYYALSNSKRITFF